MSIISQERRRALQQLLEQSQGNNQTQTTRTDTTTKPTTAYQSSPNEPAKVENSSPLYERNNMKTPIQLGADGNYYTTDADAYAKFQTDKAPVYLVQNVGNSAFVAVDKNGNKINMVMSGDGRIHRRTESGIEKLPVLTFGQSKDKKPIVTGLEYGDGLKTFYEEKDKSSYDGLNPIKRLADIRSYIKPQENVPENSRLQEERKRFKERYGKELGSGDKTSQKEREELRNKYKDIEEKRVGFTRGIASALSDVVLDVATGLPSLVGIDSPSKQANLSLRNPDIGKVKLEKQKVKDPKTGKETEQTVVTYGDKPLSEDITNVLTTFASYMIPASAATNLTGKALNAVSKTARGSTLLATANRLANISPTIAKALPNILKQIPSAGTIAAIQAGDLARQVDNLEKSPEAAAAELATDTVINVLSGALAMGYLDKIEYKSALESVKRNGVMPKEVEQIIRKNLTPTDMARGRVMRNVTKDVQKGFDDASELFVKGKSTTSADVLSQMGGASSRGRQSTEVGKKMAGKMADAMGKFNAGKVVLSNIAGGVAGTANAMVTPNIIDDKYVPDVTEMSAEDISMNALSTFLGSLGDIGDIRSVRTRTMPAKAVAPSPNTAGLNSIQQPQQPQDAQTQQVAPTVQAQTQNQPPITGQSLSVKDAMDMAKQNPNGPQVGTMGLQVLANEYSIESGEKGIVSAILQSATSAANKALSGNQRLPFGVRPDQVNQSANIDGIVVSAIRDEASKLGIDIGDAQTQEEAVLAIENALKAPITDDERMNFDPKSKDRTKIQEVRAVQAAKQLFDEVQQNYSRNAIVRALGLKPNPSGNSNQEIMSNLLKRNDSRDKILEQIESIELFDKLAMEGEIGNAIEAAFKEAGDNEDAVFKQFDNYFGLEKGTTKNLLESHRNTPEKIESAREMTINAVDAALSQGSKDKVSTIVDNALQNTTISNENKSKIKKEIVEAYNKRNTQIKEEEKEKARISAEQQQTAQREDKIVKDIRKDRMSIMLKRNDIENVTSDDISSIYNIDSEYLEELSGLFDNIDGRLNPKQIKNYLISDLDFDSKYITDYDEQGQMDIAEAISVYREVKSLQSKKKEEAAAAQEKLAKKQQAEQKKQSQPVKVQAEEKEKPLTKKEQQKIEKEENDRAKQEKAGIQADIKKRQVAGKHIYDNEGQGSRVNLINRYEEKVLPDGAPVREIFEDVWARNEKDRNFSKEFVASQIDSDGSDYGNFRRDELAKLFVDINNKERNLSDVFGVNMSSGELSSKFKQESKIPEDDIYYIEEYIKDSRDENGEAISDLDTVTNIIRENFVSRKYADEILGKINSRRNKSLQERQRIEKMRMMNTPPPDETPTGIVKDDAPTTATQPLSAEEAWRDSVEPEIPFQKTEEVVQEQVDTPPAQSVTGQEPAATPASPKKGRGKKAKVQEPQAQEPKTTTATEEPVAGYPVEDEAPKVPFGEAGHKNRSNNKQVTDDQPPTGFGWKLHVAAEKENYRDIDEWIWNNTNKDYKLLSGGLEQNSDFTIYVGSLQEAQELARKIESEIGDKIIVSGRVGKPNSTDILFGEKVSGRFDANVDSKSASSENKYKKNISSKKGGEEFEKRASPGMAGIPLNKKLKELQSKIIRYSPMSSMSNAEKHKQYAEEYDKELQRVHNELRETMPELYGDLPYTQPGFIKRILEYTSGAPTGNTKKQPFGTTPVKNTPVQADANVPEVKTEMPIGKRFLKEIGANVASIDPITTEEELTSALERIASGPGIKEKWKNAYKAVTGKDFDDVINGKKKQQTVEAKQEEEPQMSEAELENERRLLKIDEIREIKNEQQKIDAIFEEARRLYLQGKNEKTIPPAQLNILNRKKDDGLTMEDLDYGDKFEELYGRNPLRDKVLEIYEKVTGEGQETKKTRSSRKNPSTADNKPKKQVVNNKKVKDQKVNDFHNALGITVPRELLGDKGTLENLYNHYIQELSGVQLKKTGKTSEATLVEANIPPREEFVEAFKAVFGIEPTRKNMQASKKNPFGIPDVFAKKMSDNLLTGDIVKHDSDTVSGVDIAFPSIPSKIREKANIPNERFIGELPEYGYSFTFNPKDSTFEFHNNKTKRKVSVESGKRNAEVETQLSRLFSDANIKDDKEKQKFANAVYKAITGQEAKERASDSYVDRDTEGQITVRDWDNDLVKEPAIENIKKLISDEDATTLAEYYGRAPKGLPSVNVYNKLPVLGNKTTQAIQEKNNGKRIVSFSLDIGDESGKNKKIRIDFDTITGDYRITTGKKSGVIQTKLNNNMSNYKSIAQSNAKEVELLFGEKANYIAIGEQLSNQVNLKLGINPKAGKKIELNERKTYFSKKVAPLSGTQSFVEALKGYEEFIDERMLIADVSLIRDRDTDYDDNGKWEQATKRMAEEYEAMVKAGRKEEADRIIQEVTKSREEDRVDSIGMNRVLHALHKANPHATISFFVNDAHLKKLMSELGVSAEDIQRVDIGGLNRGVRVKDENGNPVVLLNYNLSDINTPLHEFSHVWADMNPKLWEDTTKLFNQTEKGQEYLQKALDSEFSDEFIKRFNDNDITDDERQHVLDEALTYYLGDTMSQKQMANPRTKVAMKIKDLFDSVGQRLGIISSPNIPLHKAIKRIEREVLGSKLSPFSKVLDRVQGDWKPFSPKKFQAIDKEFGKQVKPNNSVQAEKIQDQKDLENSIPDIAVDFAKKKTIFDRVIADSQGNVQAFNPQVRIQTGDFITKSNAILTRGKKAGNIIYEAAPWNTSHQSDFFREPSAFFADEIRKKYKGFNSSNTSLAGLIGGVKSRRVPVLSNIAGTGAGKWVQKALTISMEQATFKPIREIVQAVDKYERNFSGKHKKQVADGLKNLSNKYSKEELNGMGVMARFLDFNMTKASEMARKNPSLQSQYDSYVAEMRTDAGLGKIAEAAIEQMKQEGVTGLPSKENLVQSYKEMREIYDSQIEHETLANLASRYDIALDENFSLKDNLIQFYNDGKTGLLQLKNQFATMKSALSSLTDKKEIADLKKEMRKVAREIVNDEIMFENFDKAWSQMIKLQNEHYVERWASRAGGKKPYYIRLEPKDKSLDKIIKHFDSRRELEQYVEQLEKDGYQFNHDNSGMVEYQGNQYKVEFHLRNEADDTPIRAIENQRLQSFVNSFINKDNVNALKKEAEEWLNNYAIQKEDGSWDLKDVQEREAMLIKKALYEEMLNTRPSIRKMLALVEQSMMPDFTMNNRRQNYMGYEPEANDSYHWLASGLRMRTELSSSRLALSAERSIIAGQLDDMLYINGFLDPSYEDYAFYLQDRLLSNYNSIGGDDIIAQAGDAFDQLSTFAAGAQVVASPLLAAKQFLEGQTKLPVALANEKLNDNIQGSVLMAYIKSLPKWFRSPYKALKGNSDIAKVDKILFDGGVYESSSTSIKISGVSNRSERVRNFVEKLFFFNDFVSRGTKRQSALAAASLALKNGADIQSAAAIGQRVAARIEGSGNLRLGNPLQADLRKSGFGRGLQRLTYQMANSLMFYESVAMMPFKYAFEKNPRKAMLSLAPLAAYILSQILTGGARSLPLYTDAMRLYEQIDLLSDDEEHILERESAREQLESMFVKNLSGKRIFGSERLSDEDARRLFRMFHYGATTESIGRSAGFEQGWTDILDNFAVKTVMRIGKAIYNFVDGDDVETSFTDELIKALKPATGRVGTLVEGISNIAKGEKRAKSGLALDKDYTVEDLAKTLLIGKSIDEEIKEEASAVGIKNKRKEVESNVGKRAYVSTMLNGITPVIDGENVGMIKDEDLFINALAPHAKDLKKEFIKEYNEKYIQEAIKKSKAKLREIITKEFLDDFYAQKEGGLPDVGFGRGDIMKKILNNVDNYYASVASAAVLHRKIKEIELEPSVTISNKNFVKMMIEGVPFEEHGAISALNSFLSSTNVKNIPVEE